MAQVAGCHLVGSVNLADSEAVFRTAVETMPRRLKRVPDGETGERHNFTLCQIPVFEAVPGLLAPFNNNASPDQGQFTEEEIDAGIAKLKAAGINTRYDEYAIASYGVFKRLRAEGVIPAGVRFQVCLPTAPNAIVLAQFAFHAKLEPLYQAALDQAMRRIQDAIPHDDLAIQIDLAVDTAFWEKADADRDGRDVGNTGMTWFRAWFEGRDVKQHITDYIVRILAQVDPDVEVGLHNCYGDINHRHWFEPTSLKAVVERGIRIMERTPHPINFFHCPVPKSAINNLEAYLAPLKDLVPWMDKHATDLYLGVVHEHHPEMTAKMIEAASKVVPRFGVGTECGLGRVEDESAILDAFRISADVSQPILP